MFYKYYGRNYIIFYSIEFLTDLQTLKEPISNKTLGNDRRHFVASSGDDFHRNLVHLPNYETFSSFS